MLNDQDRQELAEYVHTQIVAQLTRTFIESYISQKFGKPFTEINPQDYAQELQDIADKTISQVLTRVKQGKLDDIELESFTKTFQQLILNSIVQYLQKSSSNDLKECPWLNVCLKTKFSGNCPN